MTSESERNSEGLRREFANFAKYGRKFERAVETVMSGGVKETLFVPSGRRVFTVVGTLGDEFIDPETPYCSCSNFYFKVTNGKEETCYHLLSYAIASRTGKMDVTRFDDVEYPSLVKTIVSDIFNVLRHG